MNDKIKSIISHVITGFVCLLIGAGGCFFGVYFYPTNGLRDAQRLIQSTKDNLEQSKRTNNELEQTLITANGIISKLTDSIGLGAKEGKGLEETIRQSYDINGRIGDILAKYDEEK